MPGEEVLFRKEAEVPEELGVTFLLGQGTCKAPAGPLDRTDLDLPSNLPWQGPQLQGSCPIGIGHRAHLSLVNRPCLVTSVSGVKDQLLTSFIQDWDYCRNEDDLTG